MTTQLDQRSSSPRLTDAVIGQRVHQLMWPDRTKTQSMLGRLLGIDQAAISKRLRGKTKWSAIDIALTANWLGVDTCVLLAPEVPPAGFEPAAFCSEGGPHENVFYLSVWPDGDETSETSHEAIPA